jgi:drug/metabolite transporter (DMT)-like permease
VKQHRPWFLYAMIIVVAWGVWGAWSDYPSKPDPEFPQNPVFPMTLVYVVWAFTLIPPAVFALWLIGWKLEYNLKSILFGCAAGFLGAGGQLILFPTLDLAPAYLVFPFIALSPVVTIVLALILSKERATMKGWTGIALAVVAGVLLGVPADYGQDTSKSDDAAAAKTSESKPSDSAAAKADNASPADAKKATSGDSQVPSTSEKTSWRYLWVVLALLILLAWGLQGFVISHANRSMKAESIFFYMMLTGLLLIPVALKMTDFTNYRTAINWGFKGPPLTAMIQILNSVGALLLVYTFRYGKAIIVSPLTNAGAPVVTVFIGLVMLRMAHKLVWTPGTIINCIGIGIAVVATVLMAIEGEKAATEPMAGS